MKLQIRLLLRGYDLMSLRREQAFLHKFYSFTENRSFKKLAVDSIGFESNPLSNALAFCAIFNQTLISKMIL